MRVLWTHTFSPNIKNASVFMDPLIRPLKNLGVDVVPLYVGGLRRNPFLALRIYKQARALSRDCDLIHAQYGSLCGLLTAFVQGKKLISLRGSDLYPVHEGPLRFRLRLRISRLLTYISLCFYKHIIVMSHDMQRILHCKFPRANVTIIPDGIDLNKFVPMDRQAARTAIGVTDDKPYVLFTSVHFDNPVKRRNLAEMAVKEAQKTNPDIRILVPENVDHDLMPYFVNASNLILSTSTHEGWPNCIKEALACNIPFVSTEVSDLREITLRKPVCRIEKADAQSLAAGILAVLVNTSPRELRDEAEKMEMGVCAAAIKNVYEALLSNAR